MKKRLFIIAGALLLSACDKANVDKPAASLEPAKVVKRNADPAQLARGAILYQQNCAVCHGEQAEGTENWQKRDKDGRFPPPPLNGKGHTWHHPTDVLKYTIRHGTAKLGGNMPGFSDKLDDDNLNDILVFLQAKWPEPLYEAWRSTDERSRKTDNK